MQNFQNQQEEPKPIRPYLIRAVLEYCRDTGATPYVVVQVDDYCRVPTEYVREGQIVFDVSDEAVHKFNIDDEAMTFQARFGENNVIFDVYVPVNRISMVMPLENQHCGFTFKVLPTQPLEEKVDEPSENMAPRRPARVK